MILQPKSTLGGHPPILGRPWLETNDAYISCHFGNMTIENGAEIKNITLYPPAKIEGKLKKVHWFDKNEIYEEIIQPLLTIK